ncbi:MAG TPA: GTP 3',8-cyclase MoaA [Deltaproteobacteria bacterium]|nr:MAG: cyclic pyranopterin phosphate synthase MoaA [Deltaproteobacteria bacterium GWC2_65_14]HBO70762.1 GTP 3',8-cyclase MoaA [Deltaproteobacteria bacterium]
MSVIDLFGRRINYLRLSVTGRCDLRCGYCRPQGAGGGPEGRDLLSDEALLLIARTSVDLGIEKIRVTGGEPLVRHGILRLLSRLSAIPGLAKLVLTTNGLRLAESAPGLREAGVESINVSLDSLRADRFARITGGGDLSRVLAGIERAQGCGFHRVKINTVVMRGVNEDEVEEFAALTRDRPIRVRFIEYMPAASGGCARGITVPGEEILDRLSKRYRLDPMEKEELGGPARYFRIEGGAGAVGVITPISCHFCEDCNRIRVTSSGVAKGCLFSRQDVDLKPFLRNGDAKGLRRALLEVVRAKPDRHPLCPDGFGAKAFAMSAVGG